MKRQQTLLTFKHFVDAMMYGATGTAHRISFFGCTNNQKQGRKEFQIYLFRRKQLHVRGLSPMESVQTSKSFINICSHSDRKSPNISIKTMFLKTHLALSSTVHQNLDLPNTIQDLTKFHDAVKAQIRDYLRAH